jgi:hypothetical protein
MPALLDHLTPSQVRVTVITEATGNCTLEASPFIESKTKLPLPTTVYLFRSKILQLPSQARSNMAL